MQVERKLGGRLLDNPKQILFQYGAGNLCMTIEELDPAWRCKSTTNYQVNNMRPPVGVVQVTEKSVLP